MLKHTLTLIVLIASLGYTQVQAQVLLDDAKLPTPYSSLTTLTGYSPSLLASEQSAKNLYDVLPTSIFKNSSWCYQRAHNWSELMEEHYSIKSMKVFLYFTTRYQREFAYPWYFHTAPVVPTLMKDGSIQDLVFDPTFTTPIAGTPATDLSKFDNKPVTIQRWTEYFIYPKTECKLIDNYQDFLDGQDKYYCYVMKTPMYNYSPNDFLSDQKGPNGYAKSGATGSTWFDESNGVRNGWRPGDLDNAKKGLKSTD